MKLLTFFVVLIVKNSNFVFSQEDDEVKIKCKMPEDITASRQHRLHHLCESNRNQQFAIEIHDGFYCIFYDVSAITLFEAETNFKIKIDGNWKHEHVGAEKYEVSNKTIMFTASAENVVILISRINDEDEMPRIYSVIIEDGSLPPDASVAQEFCTCDKCGQANEAVGVIIGGMEALDGFWPWNAALYHRQNSSYTNFRCSATIINQRTLLTTATCLMTGMKQIAAEKLVVSVRETSLFSASGKKLAVKEIKVHENFTSDVDDSSTKNKLKLDFNIAVLILTKDINFSPNINAACMPNSINYDFKGKKGFAVGWGLKDDNQLSTKLKQLEVPTFTYLDCFYRNRNLFSGFSSKRNFCAGFKNGNGLCFGDAGGGLFIKNGKRFFLYGLSSFSNCHCEQGKCSTTDESIFANVPAYLQWIHNNMY